MVKISKYLVPIKIERLGDGDYLVKEKRLLFNYWDCLARELHALQLRLATSHARSSSNKNCRGVTSLSYAIG